MHFFDLVILLTYQMFMIANFDLLLTQLLP